MARARPAVLLVLLLPWLAPGQPGANSLAPSPGRPEVQPLALGEKVRGTLTSGRVHQYEVRLRSGEAVRLAVKGVGIWASIDLVGPDDARLAGGMVEGFDPAVASAELTARVAVAGAHRIRLKNLWRDGEYELKVETVPLDTIAALEGVELRQRRAVTGWLKQNAIAVRTTEPGSGLADLRPLKALIGGSRVVTMGEATHGAREFFQLKHRLLEYFVEELGFRAFAIEAEMADAFDINEYVLGATGDPGKALTGLLLWAWNCEEVLDLIRWMRRYNQDPRHLRKVVFYGIDNQQGKRPAREALRYLRRVDGEDSGPYIESLERLGRPLTSDVRTDQDRALAARLLEHLDARKSAFVERSSLAEWSIARQHVRLVAQWLEYRAAKSSEKLPLRARHMVDNIAWILEREGPDSRVAAWAHNFHVGMREGHMGGYLKQRLGPALFAMGFSFHQGEFRAVTPPDWSLGTSKVEPAVAGSIDSTLASAGLPLAIVPLRQLPGQGLVAEWFQAKRLLRQIGADYHNDESWHYSNTLVKSAYDAMVFVETTTAARTRPQAPAFVPPVCTSLANPGFEDSVPGGAPEAWVESPAPLWMANQQRDFDFVVAVTGQAPHSGRTCVEVSRLPGKHYGPVNYGGVAQRIDATPFRGFRVRLRAAVRAEVAGAGNQVHLWMGVNNQTSPPFWQANLDRPIRSPEWRTYEIVVPAARDAITIDLGLLLVGDGRAWLDDVSLERMEADR